MRFSNINFQFTNIHLKILGKSTEKYIHIKENTFLNITEKKSLKKFITESFLFLIKKNNNKNKTLAAIENLHFCLNFPTKSILLQ